MPYSSLTVLESYLLRLESLESSGQIMETSVRLEYITELFD
jgi:hypothetical protein